MRRAKSGAVAGTGARWTGVAGLRRRRTTAQAPAEGPAAEEATRAASLSGSCCRRGCWPWRRDPLAIGTIFVRLRQSAIAGRTRLHRIVASAANPAGAIPIFSSPRTAMGGLPTGRFDGQGGWAFPVCVELVGAGAVVRDAALETHPYRTAIGRLADWAAWRTGRRRLDWCPRRDHRRCRHDRRPRGQCREAVTVGSGRRQAPRS